MKFIEEYLRTHRRLQGKIEPKYRKGLPHIVENRTNFFFDYSTSEYCEKYDELVNVSRTIIDDFQAKKFLKEDVNFFYCDNKDKDAYGGRQSEQYGRLSVVGISSGLIERLLTYCAEISEDLEKIGKERNIDIDRVFIERFETFIFREATHFLIFHELAHVIQSENNPALNSVDSENTKSAAKDPFVLESHIKELDADQFAARLITKIVIGGYDKLNEELQTPHNLADIIGITLLGIYILFHVLSDELSSDIYFRNGDHPHQSIRIKAIIETINGTFDRYDREKYKINIERMTDLFVHTSVHVTGSVHKFVEHMASSRTASIAINDYLNEMMQETRKRDWALTMLNIG